MYSTGGFARVGGSPAAAKVAAGLWALAALLVFSIGLGAARTLPKPTVRKSGSTSYCLNSAGCLACSGVTYPYGSSYPYSTYYDYQESYSETPAPGATWAAMVFTWASVAAGMGFMCHSCCKRQTLCICGCGCGAEACVATAQTWSWLLAAASTILWAYQLVFMTGRFSYTGSCFSYPPSCNACSDVPPTSSSEDRTRDPVVLWFGVAATLSAVVAIILQIPASLRANAANAERDERWKSRWWLTLSRSGRAVMEAPGLQDATFDGGRTAIPVAGAGGLYDAMLHDPLLSRPESI